MTEIVQTHPEAHDLEEYSLRRADGTFVTDTELGWPQPVGVTASFMRRSDVEQALEQLGCDNCGDEHATYVRWAGIALCSTCLGTRAADEEGDAAFEAERDRC